MGGRSTDGGKEAEMREQARYSSLRPRGIETAPWVGNLALSRENDENNWTCQVLGMCPHL